MDIVVSRLGIDFNTAEAMVNKLGGEGCLEDDEVDGQWKVVKKVVESSAIPKFIGRRKGKKSGGKRSVPCAPGASLTPVIHSGSKGRWALGMQRGEDVKIKEDGQDDGVCQTPQ